jgi:hypothetical protein
VANDNTYVCTEHLLTKRQILPTTALEVPLSKSGLVLQACCYLHNYCINEKLNASEASRIETAKIIMILFLVTFQLTLPVFQLIEFKA